MSGFIGQCLATALWAAVAVAALAIAERRRR